MPVLPIPMIIALVLLALLAYRMVTRDTHVTLLVLIGVCATQSAIIALVQYYGVTFIRPMQPLLASLIPSVSWLAFSQAARGDARMCYFLQHSAGFIATLIVFLLYPQMLDILIPILFAGYGVAMMIRLMHGEDSLPHSRLESGMMSLLVWRILAVSLIASAASDVFIDYNLAAGEPSVLLWVPSVLSSFILLSLGILSLSYAAESRHDDGREESNLSEEDIHRDKFIITHLDNYVQTQKAFLDPDLTLSRLSRRLSIPVKQLSTAINRVKGENVSRYVNRHRINHACELMLGGTSVTAAMLSSGFNTKSNFNREYLRIKEVSPRKWLETQS